MTATAPRAPSVRCRPAGRGRRSARAAACRRRAPAPTRTTGRSAPARVRRRAHRRPRQRRAAPAAAGGTGRRLAGRARAPRRPARCRSARGSRRTGGSSGAPPVPTSTTWSPGTSGSAPAPRSRSTSQRSAVHARGSRPERSRTCGARPSTAARPTNRPPTVLSRTSATAVGSPAGSADSACRALRSSELQRSSPLAGTPNQTARTARAEAGMRSTSWATPRSFATVAPARIPASTAAAAAMPSAATSAPPSRRRRRPSARPTTYQALRTSAPSSDAASFLACEEQARRGRRESRYP